MTNGIPLSISSDSVNITYKYKEQVQIPIYRSGHCYDRIIYYNFQNPSVRCFLRLEN